MEYMQYIPYMQWNVIQCWEDTEKSQMHIVKQKKSIWKSYILLFQMYDILFKAMVARARIEKGRDEYWYLRDF